MSDATDERIVNLEIKQAFLERSLDELDAVVRGLNLEVQRLHKEVDRLQRQQLEDSGEPKRPARLEDEVPPHY
ncbi:MAG: SlyX family protein [Myxococcales bacterium]|jgi:uncharacterized coiled-coil protein SlyX|nr:SlyX family protein [Myxococcales bacterium]